MTKLLLRSGQSLSLCFYGGQGGGKSAKSTGLEIGNMLSVELQKKSSRQESEVFHAREFDILWYHKNIRYSYYRFAVLCFMSEIIQTLSEKADEGLDDFNDHSMGNFRVFSNALVYLDKEALEDKHTSFAGLAFFLIKLLFEQGVAPCLMTCAVSGAKLENLGPLKINSVHGGFCFQENLEEGDDRPLLDLLREVAHKKFSELSPKKEFDYYKVSKKLIDFLLYQFQLDFSHFKALKNLY